MKFTIEIKLGNDGMRLLTDIETTLQAVARRFHCDGEPEAGDGENILDINGNTVGKWEVSQ